MCLTSEQVVMWTCWLIACVLVTKTVGKTVYLEDLNNDHDKRNFEFGLPETLAFRLAHEDGVLNLNLRENTRLNAVFAPVTVSDEDRGVVKVDLPPNNRAKFYQDRENNAYFTGQCLSQAHSACSRTLTGNIVINGNEYKLEPVENHLDARGFSAHLGSPHSLELLETRAYTSNLTGDGTSVYSELDYVIPDREEQEAHATLSEDEAERGETEALLRNLLEKLRSLEKRATPIAHGVEMLLVIDHVIFQEFMEIYANENDAIYAIRQYYSHIVNGVDLRYASIQRDDVSIYVTVAGFYISRNESQSTWMDYTKTKPDGLAGLNALRSFRTNSKLPKHDHAALITGADIQSGGYTGVAGIAYVEGLCGYFAVSINEEMGFFKGSGILAHELGHNIGSYHDSGSEDSGCWSQDKYIMAPSVPSLSAASKISPWRFSSCSINSFLAYLNKLGSRSCTLVRSSLDNEDNAEYKLHTQGLAGKLYTENDQCELLRGDGATVCNVRDKNTEAICRSLECKSAGQSTCYRYLPAHGTPCGSGKMCFEGKCQVEECFGRNCDDGSGGGGDSGGDGGNGGGGGNTAATTEAYTSTEAPMTTTPDRYVCSNLGINGLSCAQIQKFLGSKDKLCNKFAHYCCSTCTDKSVCKADKKGVQLKRTYTCNQLMELYGHNTGCRLFTKPCCATCRA